MIHLSLEDIDNDIDKACIEVMAHMMTEYANSNSWGIGLDILMIDPIKLELQRIALAVHAFIESKKTKNKTNITTNEVVTLNLGGESFFIPVSITGCINKKEPQKQVDWCSSSEEAAFAHMKDVLDNMDELLVQVDDEKARIVTDNIMEQVQESIQGIVKKVLIQGKDGFNNYDVREMAVKNILARLEAEKKVEEPKLEEVPESQKVDPSLIKCFGKDVSIVQVIEVPLGARIERPKLQELSLHQLIRKYQLELLQLEQLFPTLEICRYLDIDPKIRDMFFPLTKDVIDSKIDISMPHPLPSMIDEFIKELHEQKYLLIYKPNIPR